MLPAQRHAAILERISRVGAASLQELSDHLGVSVSTVRRDVDFLCASAHLERTHGGAMLGAPSRRGFEPDASISSAMFSREKTAIGRRAADMVKAGQAVIFDSGSTTVAAAAAVVEAGLPITAITNDLRIGSLFSHAAQISATLVGGDLRRGSTTLLGAGTTAALSRLHADVVFIGSHAIDAETLSDTHGELCEIKSILLQCADRVVLLADSSKFFSRALCAFGKPTDVHCIVTDSNLSDEAREVLLGSGVTLDIVDVD
jgi:DeoR/GlpR family transcriptional regulator of sugar metabolism